MSGGWFITFEGGEGCGKSTQVRLLAGRFRRLGRSVRELREPGGTPLAEEIRATLKHSAAGAGMTAEAELLLMNAARAQLVREVIRPALAAGEVVLCDRFVDSTVAYQGWGRQLDIDRVAEVLRFAVGPTWPQLTFLLRVPEDVAAGRRRERALTDGEAGPADRFEEAGQPFFQRVEAGFNALAAAEPGRIRVVDASPGVDEVQAQIWKVLVGRWPELALRVG